jgi:methyltransferase (TIGR00027 family)
VIRLGRASLTAELVALWRALADAGATRVPGFHDPVAREFLGPVTSRLYREHQRPIPALEVIPLRVLTIDAALTRAVDAGARQLVLLGAGFDTRAWRMDMLEKVRVFEVDHPATQQVKRTRAAHLSPRCAALTYVPVDFARDRLDDALATAGHDPRAPTVWIWEGVLMYLTDAALRGTLATVRALSAPGSTLIIHYHSPDPPGAVSALRHGLFQVLFEPHVGLRTADVLRAELEAAGFAVQTDIDAAEQAAALGARMRVGPRERTSRVAVAAPVEGASR